MIGDGITRPFWWQGKSSRFNKVALVCCQMPEPFLKRSDAPGTEGEFSHCLIRAQGFVRHGGQEPFLNPEGGPWDF